MAIEIIPKPEVKMPSWPGVLFYLSLVLLLLLVLSYFILGSLQKNFGKTLEDLKDDLAKIETPERKNLEKKILGQKKKIDDFSTLLNVHQKSSNFFTFFENLSHPKAFFSNIDLNINQGSLNLSGQTESLQTLGQQLLILKEEKLIKNVNLSKVLIGEKGKIDFSLELSLDPKVFK